MKINDPKETKNVMALCNIDAFEIIFRKLIYSFRVRIYKSNNILVNTIVNSTYFYTCATAAHWHKVLF